MAKTEYFVELIQLKVDLTEDEDPVVTENLEVLYAGDNEMVANVEFERAKQKLKG